MADSPYTRVYHSIVDDPKFATVYDDDRRLATWLRLLLIADQAYPSSAYIPAGTNRAAVAALAESGLIDLGTGSRYRVHGLAVERGRRSEAARVGGLASGRSRAERTTVERPLNERRTESNLAEPSLAEPSRALSRDGLPNLGPDELAALETATGHVASMAGDKTLGEYDRLVGDHGLPAVVEAFGSIAKGKRMTARQLVWGAVKILEPFISDRAAADTPAPVKPFVPRKLEPWEQEYRDAIAARNGGFDS
jgi:hypothetical protein